MPVGWVLKSIPCCGSSRFLAPRPFCSWPAHRSSGGWSKRSGRVVFRKKLENAVVIPELWRSYASLGDVDARRAFLRTLRAVIDPRGQSVSAADKLWLAAGIPTLIIWGAEDRIIPVKHAHAAHAAIPGSWLEIIEGVGHYVHCEAPDRFVEALTEFIESTRPARIKVSRKRILGPPGQIEPDP